MDIRLIPTLIKIESKNLRNVHQASLLITFEGTLPAQKNIVLANAAFGIQVMEKGKKSIEECVEIARESIDSGKALATFKKFVELNS